MTPEKLADVAKGFMDEWQFPNCLGAIDGKHIRIKAPNKSGSQFFNYKGYFSLVLMATCDAKSRFTWVDIGQYGSISDGGVWNNTAFAENLHNNLVNLPPPKRLPGSNVSTNYAFVGDEAFPLREYLLRPYSRMELGDAERIFNYRLSRARRTIENAFGILTSRWLIYHRPIGHNPDNSIEIVRATTCLHNFLMSSEEEIPAEERLYCPLGFEEAVGREGAVGLDGVQGLGPNNPNRRAAAQRDELKDYFVSDVGESQAPWQYAMAFQGLNINVPDEI